MEKQYKMENEPLERKILIFLMAKFKKRKKNNENLLVIKYV